MRQNFTNRRLTQVSDRTFRGGGFEVIYEQDADSMDCIVVLDGHGVISNRSVSMLSPTVALAKIHSAVAFRSHFSLSGQPHEYNRRKLECPCDAVE